MMTDMTGVAGTRQTAMRGLLSARRVVAAYLVAIALAEVFVARGAVALGMACDALLIPTLLTQYVWRGAAAYRQVLPALALLPLLRILSITMPVRGVPQIYWYVLAGLPLLVAALMTARALGVTRGELGLGVPYWPEQIVVMLTGLPLSLAAYLLLHPRPLIPRIDTPQVVTAALILIVFVGLTEELVFRGLVLHGMSSLFGLQGIVWSAVAYAAVYAGALSPAYTGFMGLVGLLFGWCAARTGSIWGVVIAHSILIVGLTCVWPFIRL